MSSIDWHAMFVPTVSLLEIVLRGSAVYLSIVALMRLFRREAGTLSTTDLIVVVLVADAAQNAMAADYHSITEGLVLVARSSRGTTPSTRSASGIPGPTGCSIPHRCCSSRRAASMGATCGRRC